MVVRDNIEKVWIIEDNKLIKANKIVSKVDYQGQEFAVLKTERDERFQEMLIKDKNNEYWKMNIAGIEFEHFINAVLDQTLVESTVYCRNVMEKLSKINLKDFFYKTPQWSGPTAWASPTSSAAPSTTWWSSAGCSTPSCSTPSRKSSSAWWPTRSMRRSRTAS